MLTWSVSLAVCSVIRGVRALAAPTVVSPLAASRHTWTPQSAVIIGKRDSSSLPEKPRAQDAAPRFAFAFDIDGVLLHVSKPIPGATESLRYLQKHHIPFILLTNGGGKREADRVADLSQKLGVPLSTSNFVQSHTPFRQLVSDNNDPNNLANKTVLATGSDYAKSRAVLHSYGFQNVITPADIIAANPTIFPFRHLTELSSDTRPLPKPIHTGTGSLSSSLKIDAVFVLDDPRDWAVDIQIISDLLLSHAGYLGTLSPQNGNCTLPSCGWQTDGQPTLFFSNGDLEWSANFHLPRFGQGAFQAALAGTWRRYTGGHELKRTVIGKPEEETYRFAERVLGEHRHEDLRRLGLHEAGVLDRVYMVGDNPESDIVGANRFRSEVGTEWVSVLVKTGVWREGRKFGEGREPRVIVEDVRRGVGWALEREGW
ncbi:hypothetical protein OQA88_12066 [Cercophora sp. LCS_1]